MKEEKERLGVLSYTGIILGLHDPCGYTCSTCSREVHGAYPGCQHVCRRKRIGVSLVSIYWEPTKKLLKGNTAGLER